ncbi:hypothetical protein F0562_026992 [Nyssa sinensis]|uniref:Glutaredoxin domain-containing protein n=1 Tax=Nyssa sinensis TaxID=561372 RepID=A0A5J5B829_9ASTE|nr:hypothetical protein F0562_026992 [Nyssa sinensis]
MVAVVGPSETRQLVGDADVGVDAVVVDVAGVVVDVVVVDVAGVVVDAVVVGVVGAVVDAVAVDVVGVVVAAEDHRTEDRIVVYFTSLRGIRRTYEDCYAVRMIFRGFRVVVDERDIWMDSAYKKELLSVLGEKNVSLPQVFIRGNYVGGVDAIRQLYDVGDLAKMLKGLPIRAPGYVCESCGDARFVPCVNCNGSRKVYDEDEDQLKKCLECNENGLIRCMTCCS